MGMELVGVLIATAIKLGSIFESRIVESVNEVRVGLERQVERHLGRHLEHQNEQHSEQSKNILFFCFHIRFDKVNSFHNHCN